MHMFRVDFVCNHVNGLVETGKVLVVAESHDQARDLVCSQLNLPPTRTRTIASDKIKPPCYTIETHQSYPTTKVSMRTQRRRCGLSSMRRAPTAPRYYLFQRISMSFSRFATG